MTPNSSTYSIQGSSSKKFNDRLRKLNAEELDIKDFRLPFAEGANKVALKDIDDAEVVLDGKKKRGRSLAAGEREAVKALKKIRDDKAQNKLDISDSTEFLKEKKAAQIPKGKYVDELKNDLEVKIPTRKETVLTAQILHEKNGRYNAGLIGEMSTSRIKGGRTRALEAYAKRIPKVDAPNPKVLDELEPKMCNLFHKEGCELVTREMRGSRTIHINEVYGLIQSSTRCLEEFVHLWLERSGLVTLKYAGKGKAKKVEGMTLHADFTTFLRDRMLN